MFGCVGVPKWHSGSCGCVVEAPGSLGAACQLQWLWHLSQGCRILIPQRGLNPLQGGLTAGPPGESLDSLLKAAAALCLGLVVEVGLPFSPGSRGGFGVRPPLFSATTFSSAPKDEHRDHPPCADFAVDVTAQHLGIPEPCRLLTPHSEVPSILQDGAQEPCC